MTPTSWLRAFIATAVFGMALCAVGQSDSATNPAKAAQAKTQDEFDSYLEIVTATGPNAMMAATQAFLAQYPASELATPVYQYQMHAYEALNNFDGMLAAGKKALAGNPKSLNTLLALAPAMAARAAGRADAAQLLTDADSYARQALAELDTTRISRKTPASEWLKQKRQMQSQAHGVLGLVALQRGQSVAAVNELQLAIQLSPAPQGVDYLRLGLAQRSNKNLTEADSALRKAVELGPPVVSTAARQALTRDAAQPRP